MESKVKEMMTAFRREQHCYVADELGLDPDFWVELAELSQDDAFAAACCTWLRRDSAAPIEDILLHLLVESVKSNIHMQKRLFEYAEDIEQ